MLGKVTRILVLKFTTSEVISKKTSREVESTPLPVCLGLNVDRKIVFTIHFRTFLAKMIPSGRVQGSKRYPVPEF